MCFHRSNCHEKTIESIESIESIEKLFFLHMKSANSIIGLFFFQQLKKSDKNIKIIKNCVFQM